MEHGWCMKHVTRRHVRFAHAHFLCSCLHSKQDLLAFQRDFLVDLSSVIKPNTSSSNIIIQRYFFFILFTTTNIYEIILIFIYQFLKSYIPKNTLLSKVNQKKKMQKTLKLRKIHSNNPKRVGTYVISLFEKCSKSCSFLKIYLNLLYEVQCSYYLSQ